MHDHLCRVIDQVNTFMMRSYEGIDLCLRKMMLTSHGARNQDRLLCRDFFLKHGSLVAEDPSGRPNRRVTRMLWSGDISTIHWES